MADNGNGTQPPVGDPQQLGIVEAVQGIRGQAGQASGNGGRVTGPPQSAGNVPQSGQGTQAEAGEASTLPPNPQGTQGLGQAGEGDGAANNAQAPDGQAGQQNAPAAAVNEMQTFTPEMMDLVAHLAEINGQDSYDSMAAALGRVNRNQYLVLPVGFVIRDIPPNMVGTPEAHAHLSQQDWLQIYALNKAAAPENADPVKFALLRLEAVKAGWLDSRNQSEITHAPRLTAGALHTAIDNDKVAIREHAENARQLAFLQPLIAEHVFRTMGHHYISSDAGTYTDRYKSTFKACLLPHLATYLPPAEQYHTALHWVGPGRSHRVLEAHKGTKRIPDAITIRATAPPAGTAIVTTTAAVINAMQGANLVTQFETYGGFNLDSIVKMAAIVKADQPKYHKAYFAYNVASATPEELAALEAVKVEASNFAPYAQAFIDTYLRRADLGKAKALAKHAEQNPLAKQKAVRLFQALGKQTPDDIESLFKMFAGKASRSALEEDD